MSADPADGERAGAYDGVAADALGGLVGAPAVHVFSRVGSTMSIHSASGGIGSAMSSKWR